MKKARIVILTKEELEFALEFMNWTGGKRATIGIEPATDDSLTPYYDEVYKRVKVNSIPLIKLEE